MTLAHRQRSYNFDGGVDSNRFGKDVNGNFASRHAAGLGHSARSPQTAAAGEVSFMIFGDPAEKAAYEDLVDAFEAKQPEIDVKLIHIPGQSDYRKRLATDFAGGTPADITLINYRRYASFAAKGVLEPLGAYLAKSTVIKEADFYPEAIQPFYLEGQADVHPAEPLEPRRLLQQEAVRRGRRRLSRPTTGPGTISWRPPRR